MNKISKVLERVDPEFLKYLQENDKEALKSNSSASEDEGEVDEQLHEPAESLEVFGIILGRKSEYLHHNIILTFFGRLRVMAVTTKMM